ncbi:hypothetical protein D4S03_08765 [bacterium]|nr:MAG: hypothetical protein D4S03_08765 [bacterium]
MKTSPQNLCVGWLDLDEDAQRSAREYLAQFNGDNTLDELGFGILRDAFADVFFPATNTIMTRTRYLVFIPAMCLVVEREKLDSNAAARRLTELENRLRESLRTEEALGVIGDRAKESLSRYPSSIYWSSLRRLRIFLYPNWGLAYYQLHLADFHASMNAERDDDGLSHLNNPERRNWDKDLCDMLADGHSLMIGNGKLPASLNFALTRHEASYLRDRFKALALREGHPSILSHLLDQLHADSFSYPWNVPYPSSLTPHVSHARCFSMLTRGATLQYFHLLQREREICGIAQPACDLADVFARWWEATRLDLGNWQVDQFLAVAADLDGLRRANDAVFIKNWLKLNIQAASAQGMLENAEAHALIRHRERNTRPNKSRLHHFEYLQRWKPPDLAGIESMASDPDRLRFGLDYRAGIGSTFVRDIVCGLAGAP